MDKTIGYELIVKNVRGFNDARAWMHRLIGAGIVKCGQCDQPATHIFFQDQAEFYIRCDAHPETGPQWTGSTRWNPSAFSINVIKEKAEAWLSRQSAEDRALLTLESYDATDYYALMTDAETRHYLTGSKDTWYKVFADVTLLTTGEWAYQMAKEWGGGHVTTTHFDVVVGAWASEAEALGAAILDFNTPREMVIDENDDVDAFDEDDFDPDDDVYEDDGLWEDPNEAIVIDDDTPPPVGDIPF